MYKPGDKVKLSDYGAMCVRYVFHSKGLQPPDGFEGFEGTVTGTQRHGPIEAEFPDMPQPWNDGNTRWFFALVGLDEVTP